MDSNLPAYRIYNLNDHCFVFSTDAGIEYECQFTSYSEYFSAYPDLAEYVYAFDLFPVNKRSRVLPPDRRIAVTVIEIVAGFLADKVNAVVYVCDPNDGHGAARARKFKSWFEYYEHGHKTIIQISTDFDAGGLSLHTALLVHKENKLKQRFVQAFIELTDNENK